MTKTTTIPRVLCGLAGLMLLAIPGTSEAARAVTVLSPPEVYDTTVPHAAETAERNTEPRCYVEPKGFRNNIRFNPPCATGTRDAHPPMSGGPDKNTAAPHKRS